MSSGPQIRKVLTLRVSKKTEKSAGDLDNHRYQNTPISVLKWKTNIKVMGFVFFFYENLLL
jgi:hypothetical protein